jgi:hypothetical protein
MYDFRKGIKGHWFLRCLNFYPSNPHWMSWSAGLTFITLLHHMQLTAQDGWSQWPGIDKFSWPSQTAFSLGLPTIQDS